MAAARIEQVRGDRRVEGEPFQAASRPRQHDALALPDGSGLDDTGRLEQRPQSVERFRAGQPWQGLKRGVQEGDIGRLVSPCERQANDTCPHGFAGRQQQRQRHAPRAAALGHHGPQSGVVGHDARGLVGRGLELGRELSCQGREFEFCEERVGRLPIRLLVSQGHQVEANRRVEAQRD